MMLDRRTLISATPGLLLGTGALAQQVPAQPLATNLTPEQNRALSAAIDGWPMTLQGSGRQRPGKRPDVVFVTFRSCGYCVRMHRDFPQPSRGRTFSYLIANYVGDTKEVLINLWKNPTMANFQAYMAGTLPAQPGKFTDSDWDIFEGVQARLKVIDAMGFRGTPKIFIRRPGGYYASVGYGTPAKERLSRYG